MSGITPQTYSDLENLDRVLNRRDAEETLEPDELDNFLLQIDEALVGLATLRIDDVLREFITSHILEVKRAIDEYRFRGVRGLQEALAGYVGSLAMSSTELHKVIVDSDQKSILQRLYTVVQTGTTLVNAAKGAAWLWPHVLEAAAHMHHLIG